MENNHLPRCFSYVRFSTPEQKKGRSFQRQTEAAAKWAKEHGLTLDKSLKADEGLSAHHADHKRKGNLGIFLQQIEDGKIPKGSILIVENLDRLSREAITDALTGFLNIINAGVDIVTLMDGKRYNKEILNQDMGSLYISLGKMHNAYDESKKKSNRLRDVWKAKRKILSKEAPMTGRIPAWLILNRTTNRIEKIGERSAIVEEIFDLSIAGYGVTSIVKRINNRNEKSWGRGKQWHNSYIIKILKNRAVFGEFQPHTFQKRIKAPAGDPIKDYYPAVISEDRFYEAQRAMADRKQKGASGRTGKITNLFTKISKCGYCSAPMHCDNKGSSPKGGVYLACSSAKRSGQCEYKSFKLPAFEKAFLKYVVELDVTSILNDELTSKELIDAEKRLSTVLRKLENCKLGFERIITLVKTLDSQVAAFTKEANTLQAELTTLEKEKKSLEQLISNLKSKSVKVEEHFSAIRSLVEKLDNAGDNEKIAIRHKLKQAIAQIVESIICYPDGLREMFLKFDGKSFDVTDEKPSYLTPIQADTASNEIDLKKIVEHNKKCVEQHSQHIHDNTGLKHAKALIRLVGGHQRCFSWDKVNKEFIELAAVTDDNWLTIEGQTLDSLKEVFHD